MLSASEEWETAPAFEEYRQRLRFDRWLMVPPLFSPVTWHSLVRRFIALGKSILGFVLFCGASPSLESLEQQLITGERGKERPVCINCRYQKVKKVNFLVTEGEEGQEHGDQYYLFLKSLATAYLFSFLVLFF